MPVSSRIYERSFSISRLNVFHAMCYSYWAYSPDDAGVNAQIAARIGLPVPSVIRVEGSNAPRAIISSNKLGTQIGIAGTTSVRQWMDYVTRFGVSNVTGAEGKTFTPFEEWSQQLFEQIRPMLPAGKKLFVTGHSLGGAMAILLAEKLRNQGFWHSVTYTFGCPRVGDTAFMNAYGCLVHNIRNRGDVVPSLPPASLSNPLVSGVLSSLWPHLSRPGVDYEIPLGPQAWLNQETLVRILSPEAWALTIPARAVEDHVELTYIRSAWRIGSQLDRMNAADWYSVCNSHWGAGLSPAP